MKKKVISSLIVALSVSIAVADSLQLIGVDKKGTFPLDQMDLSGVKSIQSFMDGSLKSFDPTLPVALWNDVQPFTSVEGGKGYWVILDDAYANKSFTFDGDPITFEDVKLDPNQNLHLVSLPLSQMSDIVSLITTVGYNLKSIQSFMDGSLKSFDPTLPTDLWDIVQPFVSTENGKGYWVVTEGYNPINSSDTNTTTETTGTTDTNTTTTDLETPPAVPTIGDNTTTTDTTTTGLETPPAPPSIQ